MSVCVRVHLPLISELRTENWRSLETEKGQGLSEATNFMPHKYGRAKNGPGKETRLDFAVLSDASKVPAIHLTFTYMELEKDSLKGHRSQELREKAV